MSTNKRLVALPLLAILLMNAGFAGTAVAEPRIWVGSADLERDATLVGESVGVEVNLHNRGDGGVIRVDVTANGSDVTSERIHVEADSDKQAVINVSFDEPGQYEIEAEDKTAGTLSVTRLRVASVTDRDDGRTARVRAGALDAGTSMTAKLADDDQPFTLRRVTMSGSGEAFNRSIGTYAPADGAPFSVPSAENSPVIAAVDMDAVSGVSTSSMRFAVDRETIREHDLQTDDVTVYKRANGSYTALSTEQVATTETAIVYEATTDGGNQYIVGSLAPAFEVRSTNLGTEDAPDGQQINLRATIGNDGPIAGDYVAEMRVDGVTVTEQTVSLEPGATESITLQHTVTTQGEYQVGLGDQSAGSIVLTSDAVSGSGESGDSETESTGERTDDESLLDAEPSLPSLPSLGNIGAIELGIGASITLVGGGLIILLRR